MEAAIRGLLGQDYAVRYNRAQCIWASYGEFVRNFNEETYQSVKKHRRSSPRGQFGTRDSSPREGSGSRKFGKVVSSADIERRFRAGESVTDAEYTSQFGF